MRRVRSLPREYRPKRSYRGVPTLYLFLINCGLLTAASAAVIVREPIWAVPGVLLFGSAFGVAEANRREHLDARTRERLAPFLGRLRCGRRDGYDWLLQVLAGMDGRTPRARRRSRVALAAIAADRQLMNGLFIHTRHRHLSVAVFAARLGRAGSGALVPALASLHSDGRIRQAAVIEMGDRLSPASLPFLFERTVDWAPEVRAAARDTLRTQLRHQPDLLPTARAAYARIARRKHAAEVGQLLESR
jgi:hypothetical protein